MGAYTQLANVRTTKAPPPSAVTRPMQLSAYHFLTNVECPARLTR